MPRARRTNSPASTLEKGNVIVAETYVVFDKNKGIVKIAKKNPPVTSEQISFKFVVEVPEEAFQKNIQKVKAILPKKTRSPEPDIVTTIEQIEL